MSFRTIENDMKSGSLDKAVPILLFGDEKFLVDHYEKQLSAMFAGGNPNDLDLSVFYGGEQDDDEIIGSLDTFPMISRTRIVLVRNHPGLSSSGSSGGTTGKSAANDLSSYVAELPDTARLVFSSGGVNKTRALFKAITKHGKVYEFPRLNEGDLIGFARKRFNAMNVEIAPDVLEAFAFMTGYLEKDTIKDLFSVENDVFKIATFALSEGRSSVTHDDLEECMPGILRTDLFAMLDAISSGRKGEAIQFLESSLAGGESVFRLLPLFTGHFEIMLGYRELSAKGHSPGEITSILGERSDWRVKKLGGFAQRFELSKLQAILKRLYGLERDIKSGNVAEKLALTVLLAEM